MRAREAVSLLPFASLSAVHLGAKLGHHHQLTVASKPGLLPLLALRFAAGPRPDVGTGALLGGGMLLSWLGDVTIDRSFRTGLVAFLAAHLCLIALFWTTFRHRPSPWAWLLLPWLGFMLVVLRPRLDTLYPAVAVYATVLAAMAASATRGGVRVGLGGILFVVSDSVLALRQFTPWLRSHRWGAVVMASYLAAQALLVDGVLRPSE